MNTDESKRMIISIESRCLKIIGIDCVSISDYLCQNFEEKFQSILPSTIALKGLRDISTLIHKIRLNEIIESLWIIYRKSGMGELQSTQPNKKIWPIEVQLLMKQSHIENVNDDTVCLDFVDNYLNVLKHIREQYQRELNMKTNHLSDYTYTMQNAIKEFIQQGLESLRLEIAEQIALVQYHYRDTILKHTQVDDSGYRIRKDPAGNSVLSGAFLQVPAYFWPELHRMRKRENPASFLYRILSGSKRDPSGEPAGKQRFPSQPGRKSWYRSRMSAKKYQFQRDADKII